VSEKKEAKAKASTQKAEKVKKTKVDPITKIKRDAKGNKIMKVARGAARAKRREGIKQGWRKVANAKPMLPAAGASNDPVAEAAA
jgi:hypothetical protein